MNTHVIFEPITPQIFYVPSLYPLLYGYVYFKSPSISIQSMVCIVGLIHDACCSKNSHFQKPFGVCTYNRDINGENVFLG
jgi:hypothetical protein